MQGAAEAAGIQWPLVGSGGEHAFWEDLYPSESRLHPGLGGEGTAVW